MEFRSLIREIGFPVRLLISDHSKLAGLRGNRTKPVAFQKPLRLHSGRRKLMIVTATAI
jgi:hypothetical protein